MSLHVLAPGVLSSVQDLGRDSMAHLGVSHAGAMDPVALRLGNALVGNRADGAGLEMTGRGPRLRAQCDVRIALTGAKIQARVDGIDVPMWRPIYLRAGAQLMLDGVNQGAWSYLAVAGGIAVEKVLGSRSTDLNAAFGPFGGRAIRKDDTLICSASALPPSSANWQIYDGFATTRWSIDPAPWFDAHHDAPIRMVEGAHFALLSDDSARALLNTEFRVSASSNRVGCRLEGATLALRHPLEMISEAAVPGTLQLPPGGMPICLLAEAPTIGGYPRIGQVISVDLGHLAQRAPGHAVRFATTTLGDAQARYLLREKAIERIIRHIAQRTDI